MLDIQNSLDMRASMEPRTRGRSFHLRNISKKIEIEDYQLKQTIGSGGFGKVKKGIHKLTGEKVAVKICCVDKADHENRQAIEREVQLQKNLMHENIAKIYQVIKKDTKIYIFMEYCKNGELFDRINGAGPLPEKQAGKIFNQILSALIYLKENGLSHRDIKPENVLFDEHWNVKLIDFGFSCQADNFRRTVCGTPSYTPPQIIRKVSYDAELADVWSLGVTLYAMLTAALPFDAETNQRKKANILSCKYHSHPLLSSKAQRLLSNIFSDAKSRPRLADLKKSEFSLTYEASNPVYIDLKTESVVLEDDIVDVLDKNYRINPEKVNDSVKNCRLDRFHAMYYLTLKNQQHTHRHTTNQKLNEFKKQRKNSLIKLKPITRTPTVSKKTITEDQLFSLKTGKLLKVKEGHIRMRPKLTIDPDRCRLRKDSPDSPRRLLDCVGAYKDY